MPRILPLIVTLLICVAGIPCETLATQDNDSPSNPAQMPVTAYVLIDLSKSAPDYVDPVAINNSGTIVCNDDEESPDSQAAWEWSNGSWTSLAAAEVLALNNNGDYLGQTLNDLQGDNATYY